MKVELLHRRTGFGVEEPNSPSQVNASKMLNDAKIFGNSGM